MIEGFGFKGRYYSSNLYTIIPQPNPKSHPIKNKTRLKSKVFNLGKIFDLNKTAAKSLVPRLITSS